MCLRVVMSATVCALSVPISTFLPPTGTDNARSIDNKASDGNRSETVLSDGVRTMFHPHHTNDLSADTSGAAQWRDVLMSVDEAGDGLLHAALKRGDEDVLQLVRSNVLTTRNHIAFCIVYSLLFL